jgi:hypothetical protein
MRASRGRPRRPQHAIRARRSPAAKSPVDRATGSGRPPVAWHRLLQSMSCAPRTLAELGDHSRAAHRPSPSVGQLSNVDGAGHVRVAMSKEEHPGREQPHERGSDAGAARPDPARRAGRLGTPLPRADRGARARLDGQPRLPAARSLLALGARSMNAQEAMPPARRRPIPGMTHAVSAPPPPGPTSETESERAKQASSQAAAPASGVGSRRRPRSSVRSAAPANGAARGASTGGEVGLRSDVRRLTTRRLGW